MNRGKTEQKGTKEAKHDEWVFRRRNKASTKGPMWNS